MIYKHVLLLQVFLKFEPEYCVAALKRLTKALGSSAKPVSHNKFHIGYVLVTRESPQELMDRLFHVLEVDHFTDYTVVPVLGNPAGKHGGLNTLVTRIKFAYAALEATPTKYLAESQTLVEQRLRKSAPRKMRVESRRNG